MYTTDQHRAPPSRPGVPRTAKQEQTQVQLENLVAAGLLGPEFSTKGRKKNVEFKTGVKEISTTYLSLSRV